MRRFMVAFSVLGFVFFLTTWGIPSFAESPQVKGAPSRPNMVRNKKAVTILDYRTQLGLSDAQLNQIRKILLNYYKQDGVLRAKRGTSEQELQNMINQNPTSIQVRAKVQESASITAQIRIASIEATQKIKNVLTPSQRSKWREILAAPKR